jgi:hypothetical protein
MGRPNRDIIPRRSAAGSDLVGFGCSACEWLYSVDVERLLDTAAPKIEHVVESFEGHSCTAPIERGLAASLPKV